MKRKRQENPIPNSSLGGQSILFVALGTVFLPQEFRNFSGSRRINQSAGSIKQSSGQAAVVQLCVSTFWLRASTAPCFNKKQQVTPLLHPCKVFRSLVSDSAIPEALRGHVSCITSTQLLNPSRNGDSTTGLGSLCQNWTNLSLKKFFPNARRKPSLRQLESVSPHATVGAEPNAHLATPSCQGVVQSKKVPLEPPCLQTELFRFLSHSLSNAL